MGTQSSGSETFCETFSHCRTKSFAFIFHLLSSTRMHVFERSFWLVSSGPSFDVWCGSFGEMAPCIDLAPDVADDLHVAAGFVY